MKQCNFVLPVSVSGIDLDDVSNITFKFTQGDKNLMFHYPSSNAVYSEDTECINLIWTATEAFMFESKKEIEMDTLIKVTGSDTNPVTPVIRLMFGKTLFTEQEVEMYG